ncbi:MAG: carbohydrate ABC transporter permease [Lachnospiraceae bacterium]|nr:carbohydrate ABC transporter permease [Lachnospiraceae bacterium]
MKKKHTLVSVALAVICLIYILPVFFVAVNSFKMNTYVKSETFAMPNASSFAGIDNYRTGMTFGNYPFIKSAVFSIVITLLSTALILLFTSMAGWYIARVDSLVCRIIYYLCVFSMVVPFQMVMYTLSRSADALSLNAPLTIPLVYLGFGAGMSVFLFSGFVRALPIEVEEAAAIDGCSVRAMYFRIVVPLLAPIMISVGILEVMWIWNDYLLPMLVLDINEYRTIPIHIQYLRGSYGTVDLGASMALIVLSILPVIAVYLKCKEYIVSGVASGAVKG